jgi:hypothetical protein
MTGALMATLIVFVAASSAKGPRYCGSFTAKFFGAKKATTMYTYVRAGQVTCKKTRHVLKEWWMDTRHTQQYGPWHCEDSNGVEAQHGWVQHCVSGGKLIADRYHRF